MTNLHLKENDKIKLQTIGDNLNQNDKFREALEINILPFEDKGNLPSSKLYQNYLKPYFQTNAKENRNCVVKRRNILFIKDITRMVLDKISCNKPP